MISKFLVLAASNLFLIHGPKPAEVIDPKRYAIDGKATISNKPNTYTYLNLVIYVSSLV